MSVYQILADRGFIHQCTDQEALVKKIDQGPLCLYVGYDCTASGLHVGHLLTTMALRHWQQAGHKIIILIGGGTSLVGDPTDRTQMRQMLSREQIDTHAQGIQQDLKKFIAFEGDNPAVMVNNLDWLSPLNYLEFLRDYGVHFSVNRMIAQESVKQRFEKGLTFLEFNYSLLQAYDFMHLNKHYDCVLQLGGSDQWGNIVAGIDLTRRMNQKEVYGLTAPLLTTADGKKMGKTAAGAVWLNEDLLKPYDYYQYWINVDDQDVARFLKFFTLLELNEIEELCRGQGENLREAKSHLAFEATKICHGNQKALDAQMAAQAAFGGGGDSNKLPTLEFDQTHLGTMPLIDLFVETGLCSSRADVKRLVKGRGARVNDAILEDAQRPIETDDFVEGQCLLRVGKKKVHRLVMKNS